MIIAILAVVGLVLGSFINALVWRTHEGLSVAHGRSMCPHCKHTLGAADLVPVLSWLMLRGKCRYCKKPISAQYPLVELATGGLFVASYIWWPEAFSNPQKAVFVLWLIILTGLIALAVYDLKWFLLPNRLIYPVAMIAIVQAAVAIADAGSPGTALLNTVLGLIVGGGIFYVLFQVSKGKWIGGGDVKLGALLGLIVATPGRAILFIFFGSLLGSLVSAPLLARGDLKRTSVIPFGPFLIIGGIITVLFGGDILHWYQRVFLNM
ncbi:MAG TPA: prepilin peptidase [Candidatus Saccharimonadales bacterium]|nr:prepilin peptidase [Candidatus Saccharimonadales bacterium]